MRDPRRAGAVMGVTLLLAVAGCNTTAPSPSTSASASSGPSSPASAAPSATSAPTVSPISTPITSTSATFNLLPTSKPADFVSPVTCSGAIGASDPVALVELIGTASAAGDWVLRDYADSSKPRTVCTFGQHGNGFVQLIDARHVVLIGNNETATYAVVDLPELRYHWFRLPTIPNPTRTLLAVSPGLDQIAWLNSDYGSATDQIHLTDSSGDHVVASLRAEYGRCGTADDSNQAAYTHSGGHLYELNQSIPSLNALNVLAGQQNVLAILPPTEGWKLNAAYPAMAVWSPTSETLYYRFGADVMRWTPAGGAEKYIPGVSWYNPTISPDGSHLAYSVLRADAVGHDVYLIDLAHGGGPEVIGGGHRNRPSFVNATQLFFWSEGPDGCVTGPSDSKPLIYNIVTKAEGPSIFDAVLSAWPATSSQH